MCPNNTPLHSTGSVTVSQYKYNVILLMNTETSIISLSSNNQPIRHERMLPNLTPPKIRPCKEWNITHRDLTKRDTSAWHTSDFVLLCWINIWYNAMGRDLICLLGANLKTEHVIAFYWPLIEPKIMPTVWIALNWLCCRWGMDIFNYP